MVNPLDAIKEKLDEIEARVFLKVRIAICLETLDVDLSRLKDLDPKNAGWYTDIQAMLKEKP